MNYESSFQTFSDLFKDVYGFRPRSRPSIEEIDAWLAAYDKWAEGGFVDGPDSQPPFI